MADAPEGGDALIHLRVSRALKARWVQASRAASMTLTDWITSRLEQHPMNVFKVPQTGPLADLVYIHDEGGLIVHDNVPHPEEMTFDEEERPQ